MFHVKHFSDDIEYMTEVLRGWGEGISDEVTEKYPVYRDFLIKWNKKIHLISKRDESKIVSKHFIESLALLKVFDFKEKKRMMDIGSGAGFPSVPLKIFSPWIDLVLVESNKKKSLYLKELINILELKSVSLVNENAENLKNDNRFLNSFDIVTARAVAPIDKVLSWSLPFLKSSANEKKEGVLIVPGNANVKIDFDYKYAENIVMREKIVDLDAKKKMKLFLLNKKC